MGIVLIYRGDRIINFAQASIGVLPAVLAIELVVTYGVPFVLAAGAGIAAAIVLGALASLLPRHFRNSSRLILTVATIGLAQLLTGVANVAPVLFCNPATNESCVNASNSQSVNTPLHVSFTIGPVLFSGNDIVAVVGAILAASALALFMRYSKYGLGIRAAAENSDRATLLGVSVARLDTIIWVLAAILSTLAILLQVPVLGFGGFQTVTAGGDEILLRILAAAVIGRMESMPRTVVAALAIGVFDAGATWTYSNTTYVDASLVVVIVVALLLQRRSRSRVTEGEQSSWRYVATVRPIPRQLAGLPEVRWTLRVMKVAFVAVVVLLPLLLSDSQTYLASIIVVYTIVGLSLLVLTGWTGQISLGQFGLAGIGGAATVVLYSRHGWDFFAALAVGVLVGALVSLFIGLPALRMSGPFLAVTTLAFGVTASSYFLQPNYLPWFVTTQANRPSAVRGEHLELRLPRSITSAWPVSSWSCSRCARSARAGRAGTSSPPATTSRRRGRPPSTPPVTSCWPSPSPAASPGSPARSSPSSSRASTAGRSPRTSTSPCSPWWSSAAWAPCRA